MDEPSPVERDERGVDTGLGGRAFPPSETSETSVSFNNEAERLKILRDRTRLNGTVAEMDALELRPKKLSTILLRLVADIRSLFYSEGAATQARVYAHNHETGEYEHVNGNGIGGLFVNTRMPSKGPDQGKIEYCNVISGADALLLQPGVGDWPRGYHFHLVDLVMSGRNTSTAINTQFSLRDGLTASGARKWLFLHSVAAVGSPEHFGQEHTWQEHPIFESGVFFDFEQAPTTTFVGLTLQGYFSPPVAH